MRRLAVVLLLLAAFACRRTETTASRKVVTTTAPADMKGQSLNVTLKPDFRVIDRSALGAKLGADGAVEVSKSEFAPGETFYLTMWVHERPQGLRMSVEINDTHGKTIKREARPVGDQPVVTFTIEGKDLKPGEYHAVGYWGGNDVCDYPFTIGKAKKRPSS
jgi:methionine-rich copper-binding protein CopC